MQVDSARTHTPKAECVKGEAALSTDTWKASRVGQLTPEVRSSEQCSQLHNTRPTPEQLDRLTEYFGRRDQRSQIPMTDILWFAVHSARREAEIVRLRWSDNDPHYQTGLVRDAKHPLRKAGQAVCGMSRRLFLIYEISASEWRKLALYCQSLIRNCLLQRQVLR
jgi:hypothetical protein